MEFVTNNSPISREAAPVVILVTDGVGKGYLGMVIVLNYAFLGSCFNIGSLYSLLEGLGMHIKYSSYLY